MLKILLCLAIILISNATLHAQGSIDLSEIQPLLNQQPKLWQFIIDHFDVEPTGWGTRIGYHGIFGGPDSKIVGERIAPYVFLAKVKGAPGEDTFRLTINTDLGIEGNPPTGVDEVLTGILIEPIIPKGSHVAPFKHPIPAKQ